MRSPVVRTVISSTRRPAWRRISSSATSWLCVRASRLPRVPRRRIGEAGLAITTASCPGDAAEGFDGGLDIGGALLARLALDHQRPAVADALQRRKEAL